MESITIVKNVIQAANGIARLMMCRCTERKVNRSSGRWEHLVLARTGHGAPAGGGFFVSASSPISCVRINFS